MDKNIGYFQDTRSNVVLQFEGAWDLQEMRRNPEYREVNEVVFKEYVNKRDGKVKEK